MEWMPFPLLVKMIESLRKLPRPLLCIEYDKVLLMGFQSLDAFALLFLLIRRMVDHLNSSSHSDDN